MSAAAATSNDWQSKALATLHGGSHWDRFYRNNGSNFFRDRHWMDDGFPCLKAALTFPSTMLEIGCGTGAALLILLQRLPLLRAVGFDVSKAAVQCISSSAIDELGGRVVAALRLSAFQHSALPPAAIAASAISMIGAAEAKRSDVLLQCPHVASVLAADAARPDAHSIDSFAMPAAVKHLLQPWVGHIARASLPHLSALDGKVHGGVDDHDAGSRWTAAAPVAASSSDAAAAPAGSAGSLFDFVLLMFTLSAMPHELHGFVLREAALAVKPGTGRVLLRDYCIGDAASERLSGIGSQLYVRGDGTLAAFIDPDVLTAQAAAAGLVVEDLSVVSRAIENRAEGETFHRKWLNVVLRRAGDPAEESRYLLAQARSCAGSNTGGTGGTGRGVPLPEAAADAGVHVLTAMRRLLT